MAKNAKMALKVWEKQFEAGVVVKIDKEKTFGQYMEEFIEEVKPNLAGSSYKSYIYAMQANFYNYKISKHKIICNIFRCVISIVIIYI